MRGTAATNYKSIEERAERHPHAVRAVAPPEGASRQRLKRRLVFVTDIVTPYTVAVMAELSQLVDLTVIFSDQTGARGCDWTFGELGFPHVLLGGPAIKRANPEVTDYYLNPSILRHLKRLAPDVIISAGWSVPSWYAAVHCLTSGCALIIQSDGTPLTERQLNPLQRVSRTVLVRIAAGFAANSRQAARRFIDLGAPPEKVHSAPHSTNLEPYWEVGRRRIDARRAGRRDCGSAGDELRVLMAGRLVPRKGFDEVIRALALAHREHPGIRLSVAGSGPDRERLEALACDLGVSVEFLGFVDQPRLAAVCAQADAFVFPSTQDEFGFVLLEALAAGLACIASPFAGATGDLVVDGENGLVVNPRDHERLARALTRLADDPAARERMGERGYLSALERTPRRTAEGYALAAEAAAQRRARA